MSPARGSGARRGRRGAPGASAPAALVDAAPTLARALYSAVAYTSYTPLSVELVRARLTVLADQLVAAMMAPEYQPGAAREVGASVVAMQFTQPEALGRMQAALIGWFHSSVSAEQAASLHDRIALVMRDVATGFAAAVRDAILADQEETRVALLMAERRMQAAEEARMVAEAAVRLRTDVLNAAAHDLRTPVTAIMGHADMLQRYLDRETLPPTDRVRTHVTAIRRGAIRIRAMIEELLDAARLQAGRALELQLEPLDVSALVQDLVQVRSTTTPGEAVVRVDAPAGLLIVGDRPRLERVLENVLANAIKFSPEGAPVDVVAHRQAETVVVSVRDQGVGIPADELPRLFTPFYRASTAHGTPGIGIGLAGARAIVEQHGGQIALESTVGVGTTVTITLPSAPSASAGDSTADQGNGQPGETGHPPGAFSPAPRQLEAG